MPDNDLISRAAILDAICDRIETTDLRKYTLLEHKSKMFDIVKSVIEQAPGVDAAPVVHGRWMDRGSLSCRCSCCGCKSNAENNYCHHCGAQMDGGKDDAEK